MNDKISKLYFPLFPSKSFELLQKIEENILFKGINNFQRKIHNYREIAETITKESVEAIFFNRIYYTDFYFKRYKGNLVSRCKNTAT